MQTQSCIPNPEYLIKSIAEQGYTLETSIADLIDNCIAAEATKIEVLVDTLQNPFMLFIADNGLGMFEQELQNNMNFPSKSMDEKREPEDLGRFGLGLKTASFAQTRCFTVLSKKSQSKSYSARTWDVAHLRKTGNWEIIVNTEDEIEIFLDTYKMLSNGFLNPFIDYTPNTIVVWNGLYKFETETSQREISTILQKELTETTKEYLQLIFHRFMERENPLQIRLNNEHLKPFNPFPKGVRNISVQQKLLLGNKLRLEGFILPNRSISESKETSEWTLGHKSLMDMEGVYIYRASRIIVFGGWNGLIKKSPRLQLARLRVEIGNGIDHLFHLNVAKSSIAIPFGERIAFIRYVSDLKKEAEKEFFNYETRVAPIKNTVKAIFKKVPTTNGISLEFDKESPLLKKLIDTLSHEQNIQLKIILRIITTEINKIKRVFSEDTYTSLIEKEGLKDWDMLATLNVFLAAGISKESILNEIFPSMGINTKSLPASILSLLN